MVSINYVSFKLIFFQRKVVIWIVGGSFSHSDPRNYVSFGQQISGAVLESEVFLIGCRGKSEFESSFPHVHEQCTSMVFSIISEVATSRLPVSKVGDRFFFHFIAPFFCKADFTWLNLKCQTLLISSLSYSFAGHLMQSANFSVGSIAPLCSVLIREYHPQRSCTVP